MAEELQIAGEAGEDFHPQEEMVISNVDALKVMADTNRLRILEVLADKPLTVKQVAKHLGISPTKLYYHVNLLEEHGFIVVTGSRIVSGIIEKKYRAAALSLKIDKALLSFSAGQMSESVDNLLSVVFEAARQDVRQGIKSGLIKLSSEDHNENNSILGRTLTRMTPEQYKSFLERFISLLRQFGATLTESDEPRPAYGLTIALYPVAEEYSSEEEEPATGGRWNLD